MKTTILEIQANNLEVHKNAGNRKKAESRTSKTMAKLYRKKRKENRIKDEKM
jgi:hypothetical protein